GVEQVTPTAAALLTSIARFATPAMRLRSVGHGAGSRDDPRRPNLVRCWVGDADEGDLATPAGFDDACVELRTNLDDAAPAVVAARPDLDDCRALAAATGRPLHQVIDTVSAAARAELLP